MNLELSLLNGVTLEYSFSTQVSKPPSSSSGIESALDTRVIVDPKTGSMNEATAAGGTNVS
jgi:hypothetical protein